MLALADACRNLYCKNFHEVKDNILRLIHGKPLPMINFAFSAACEGGNKDTIELLIQHGANDWNKGLQGACKGGQENVAYDMLQRSQNTIEWNHTILKAACCGGNENLIQLAIDHMKKNNTDINWDESILLTCESGNLQIIIQNGMKEHHHFDWASILYKVIETSRQYKYRYSFLPNYIDQRLALIQMITEHSYRDNVVINWNMALQKACRAFPIKEMVSCVVEYGLKEHYLFDWDAAFLRACKSQNSQIIYELWMYGAKKTEEIPLGCIRQLLNMGMDPKVFQTCEAQKCLQVYVTKRQKKQKQIKSVLKVLLCPDVLSVISKYVEY
jgi:glycerophosphoryl diester phosphodiesterase